MNRYSFFITQTLRKLQPQFSRGQNLDVIQPACFSRSRSRSRSISTTSNTNNAPNREGSDHQTTRVLYDGECKMCKVEVAGLKWLARDKPDVEFVDITSLDYEPALYSGVTYEQAMREMHVVGPQGQIYTQGDAIRQMYRASGIGWLARFTELPVIKDVCDRMYIRFAHYRLQKAFKRCDSESDQCSIKLHHLREKMKEST